MRNMFARLNKNNKAGKKERGFNPPLISAMIFALLAGAMFPLALSPYEWWWFALISPAIFYALLNNRSAGQAFLIGQSYGFGLWSVGAFWLYTSIHVYGDTPMPLALLMIAVVGLGMGLFNGIQAWLYRRFFGHSPLTFAPLWIFAEWTKTWIFTGFPWLFAGYAFTTYQLDNFAPLAGIYAVSFVVIFIAASLVEIAKGRRFWILPSVALIAIAVGLGHIQWTTPKQAAPLSVSLIQGNIPQDLKWLTEYQGQTLAIYASLSQKEWGRDLVVWPESSIPMFQADVQPFIDAVAEHAAEHNSAWVTGIPYAKLDSYNPHTNSYDVFYNAIMASGQDSSGLYKKQRLVPFGEYVPLSGALKWVLPSLKDDVSMASFSAGSSHQQPLMVKGQRLAAAICYEVAYPNLTRNNALNSDFLVTLSNDAWFTGTDGPWQHLQMVQMRAKETGRWFIRATNTGVTAFINPQGHIERLLKQDIRAVLRGDLPAMQGNTPYMRFGDWPILIISALLLLLGGWVKRQK
ncbi:apolipoprotein N-acyltransferase [Alkanindiges sp. WGS2144]|uniref:apolipoprotein N-acyltransferase n=1 Tax=Alkanindiges sp. WGS2144 TaxID=3366808 RepID=UPI00375134FF